MPTVRVLQRSFAGGEVSPEFFGRIDDVKYQTGVAVMRNMIALPHGPVSNRPGFAYVLGVKNTAVATRLIPFTYSTTQTLAIELGAGYFRFHTQGATVLSGGFPFELANPYAAADLFDIHYVQSADVMTLVHPNYAPMELKRLGAVTWTLTAITFASLLTAPPNLRGVATQAATPNNLRVYNYLVTTTGTDGLDESPVAADMYVDPIVITAITKANPAVITVASPNTFSIGQTIDINSVLGMTQINGTGYTVASTPSSTTIIIKYSGGTTVDSTGFGVYTSGGLVVKHGLVNNLLQAGASNTISWSPVAGTVRYNVYLQSNGLYGFIGQTDGLTFVDNNIVPDLSKTPPQINTPMDGVGNYPSAVSYFQQRRIFAGSTNSTQTVWMTRSGTESNMNYSLPTRVDDSITFRIAARDVNTIRHIIPMSNLLLLTSSAEWKVTGQQTEALTPSSISVTPQSYTGANNVQPVIVNNNLIYAAARGGHIREMTYAWQANGYLSGDLSLRNPNQFDTFDIKDMAYAKCPYPIIWAVSTSGKLLGLTYVPEQQIGGWHHHDTGINDTFESCCIVAEGGVDALYVITKRMINGVQTRMVERMADHFIPNPAKPLDATTAFFVDCGSTYSGAPETVISGLDYLNGMTVNVLADGMVRPQAVVVGGSITLDHSASVVQIGLPIQADIQSLPVAGQIDNAYGQGRYKNINKAIIRISNSRGLFAGSDVNQLTEAKERTTENYGKPPNLITSDVDVLISGSWNYDGQVFIRQNDPLPLTIVSITLELAVGG
jgi:hypothetical protein